MTSFPASDMLALVVRSASRDDRLIERWLSRRSDRTAAAYRGDIRRFRARVPKALDEVSLADLEAFGNWLQQQGVAASSRKRALAAVRSLLTYGHHEGSLRTNAGALLKLPVPPDRRAEHRLSDAQIQELLDAARPPRDHALLRLLYVSGLTVSEAVALNWGDLEACGPRGRVRVVGRGRMRVLWLLTDMWTELLALGRRQSDAPVFASATGRRLRRGSVNALLARTALRAGLNVRVSPQTLRHAYAWRALERGVSLAELNVNLGHALRQTTAQYLRVGSGPSGAEQAATGRTTEG
jgi:integrase/recombinase XerD